MDFSTDTLEFREQALRVRECPIPGCEWKAPRKLLPSMWASGQAQFEFYEERCREDIAAHLVEMHGDGGKREPTLEERVANLERSLLRFLEIFDPSAARSHPGDTD